MIAVYAYLACFILFCLTLFQLALICGAPIGRFAWGGAHKVLPSKLRIGSAISIVLYAIFAVVILNSAGIIDVIGNKSIANTAIWALTAYFTIGVAMNAISRSKPERAVMTPVALLLAILCLAISLN